jgi:hypothetical protein
MSNFVIKNDLEKDIIAKSKNTHWDKDLNCHDSLAVKELLRSWGNLSQYYHDNDDNTMSIEILSEYLDWVEKFGGMSVYPQVSENCRKESQEARDELKAFMEVIIEAVLSRLYPEES